jgi:hypothetical protein
MTVASPLVFFLGVLLILPAVLLWSFMGYLRIQKFFNPYVYHGSGAIGALLTAFASLLPGILGLILIIGSISIG